MTCLFLDIETIPGSPDDGSPEWEAEALNPWKARAWMIGVAHEHDEPVVLMGPTEADCMAMLDGYLIGLDDRGVDVHRMKWVAHNVKGYDVRVLRFAAIRAGLDRLATLLRPEKWDKRFVCTQEGAAGANPTGGPSLDLLAQSCGRPVGKGELATVDFPALWRGGLEGKSIAADRCLVDVALTRWVYGKMMGIEYPEPREEA